MEENSQLAKYYSHMPFVTIDDTEGARKLLRLSYITVLLVPVPTRTVIFCLFLWDQQTVKPLVVSSDPHLEVILACMLSPGHRRHPPGIGLYPEASTWVGRAGLKCSGFKAFHRPSNAMLVCQSIFAGGVWAAMKSNHVCFPVTLTRPFIALLFSYNFVIFLELIIISYFFSMLNIPCTYY